MQTLLVANRGEIALRIMRTARALGMRTVAVFSDADRDAPHVRFADEAAGIGPAPVGESYLRIDAIVEAARATGAQAVHPGYGLLAENAEFARAVTAAGLVFVGPPAEAIDAMGNKAEARRRMHAAGVPCVPGYDGDDQSMERMTAAAESIGFPVMVKAAAGGGGRGMRVAKTVATLPDAIAAARSEALNAFGSGALLLERALTGARHVEVQVLADAHGNVVHLGERDCSVQRRHQKVIEESPCPVMSAGLRVRMGAAAVAAARAVDYRGAGTVEFLLADDGTFHFLEMNTRLQVEHPVTESVTGLDLVALQLRIAGGHPLGFVQEDVRQSGHAIEVRLCAEDPAREFLPSTGPVLLWHAPAGEGVRVDGGIETGGEISPFYDSMVAKIIAHGANREEARRRLVQALTQTALIGPRTNREFLLAALSHPVFVAGRAATTFVDEHLPGFASPLIGDAEHAIAAVLQHHAARRRALALAVHVSPELLDWSSANDLETVFHYAAAGGEGGAADGDQPAGVPRIDVRVRPRACNDYEVQVGAAAVAVQVRQVDDALARLVVNGARFDAWFTEAGDGRMHVVLPCITYSVQDLSSGARADEDAGGGRVLAPMHGTLLEVLVQDGDVVKRGQRVATLEAMKMQHEVLAGADGTVVRVAATAPVQLAAGDSIAEIDVTTE